MSRRNPYGVNGRPLEWVIQDSILEYLMALGRFQPVKFWRARPSQYIRSQGSNVGFALHPSEIGIPDILGVAYGYFVALEVKRQGGRVSAEQKAWRSDFLRAPLTRYYVVRSIEDTTTALVALQTEKENG